MTIEHSKIAPISRTPKNAGLIAKNFSKAIKTFEEEVVTSFLTKIYVMPLAVFPKYYLKAEMLFPKLSVIMKTFGASGFSVRLPNKPLIYKSHLTNE